MYVCIYDICILIYTYLYTCLVCIYIFVYTCIIQYLRLRTPQIAPCTHILKSRLCFPGTTDFRHKIWPSQAHQLAVRPHHPRRATHHRSPLPHRSRRPSRPCCGGGTLRVRATAKVAAAEHTGQLRRAGRRRRAQEAGRRHAVRVEHNQTVKAAGTRAREKHRPH